MTKSSSRDFDPFEFLASADASFAAASGRWRQESAVDSFVPEDVIDGQWRLKTEIGRGSFGVVYEACVLARPEEFVAIKLISPTSLQRWRERATQEAALALGLKHLNLVRTYAHGQLAGRVFYIVMELLEGETLAQSLAGGRGLPLPKVAALCEQLGAGLSALHARGVVHRDVKPANVFIVETPINIQIKLMDFGLCKGGADLTASHQQLGTLAYMPPEIVRAGARVANGASDVYSMALVIYEAITGHRAIRASTVEALIGRICHGPAPVSVNAIRPCVPAHVARLLNSALQRNPESRPRDAVSFGRQLAEGLAGADQVRG